MKADEIKEKLNKINDMPVMAYELKKILLQELVDEIKDDERKTIKNLAVRAEKEIAGIDAEIERIDKMMFFEKKYEEYQYVAGVDEVGRGPLAGPIVSAAVVLPKDFRIPYVNDSKKLTHKKREELYDVIMENAIAVGIGSRSERSIDEFGIQPSNYDAMKEAIGRLSVKPDVLLVDAVRIPNINIKEISIIKGDSLSISIAAASIIAKVTRDRLMIAYSALYPEYDFASNMGYGSAKHIEALKTVGPCEIHRRSFIEGILGHID